jgi:hypothetical protein
MGQRNETQVGCCRGDLAPGLGAEYRRHMKALAQLPVMPQREFLRWLCIFHCNGLRFTGRANP